MKTVNAPPFQLPSLVSVVHWAVEDDALASTVSAGENSGLPSKKEAARPSVDSHEVVAVIPPHHLPKRSSQTLSNSHANRLAVRKVIQSSSLTSVRRDAPSKPQAHVQTKSARPQFPDMVAKQSGTTEGRPSQNAETLAQNASTSDASNAVQRQTEQNNLPIRAPHVTRSAKSQEGALNAEVIDQVLGNGNSSMPLIVNASRVPMRHIPMQAAPELEPIEIPPLTLLSLQSAAQQIIDLGCKQLPRTLAIFSLGGWDDSLAVCCLAQTLADSVRAPTLLFDQGSQGSAIRHFKHAKTRQMGPRESLPVNAHGSAENPDASHPLLVEGYQEMGRIRRVQGSNLSLSTAKFDQPRGAQYLKQPATLQLVRMGTFSAKLAATLSGRCDGVLLLAPAFLIDDATLNQVTAQAKLACVPLLGVIVSHVAA